ncbi:hypothetical protein AMK33_13610 [Streptomyces sp. CB02400]|nr:hypothetical protein AMK33_13610 [Streptomyces sp. CB02400]
MLQQPVESRQFRYLNEQARDHRDAGQPVISVETKKKELVGDFPIRAVAGGRRVTWCRCACRLVLDAGASERLAVDGDRLSARGWAVAFLEKAVDGPVQGVTVHCGQAEEDGCGVRRADEAGQRVVHG